MDWLDDLIRLTGRERTGSPARTSACAGLAANSPVFRFWRQAFWGPLVPIQDRSSWLFRRMLPLRVHGVGFAQALRRSPHHEQRYG